MPTARKIVDGPGVRSTEGRPGLADRELLGGALADELAGTFKVLANDTRLRLLHALARAGELCVSDLAGELEMAPQALSNQLQRLADRRIVASRRIGNRILYRIVDPCVPALLDLGLCLTEDARQEAAVTRG
ncbi:MAG: metalloregulator ArsR/SmtB family transcription factor [Solirubrobacteraceae bacterium]